MKPLFCALGIVALMSGLATAGQVSRSGNFVVETDPGSGIIAAYNDAGAPVKILDDTLEQLVNGGFETGSLPPWYSSMWQVTSIDSHTGQYCAADVGNYSVQQDITPVLADSIVSITFWSRQPDNQIQAFDLIYSDATYYENIVWPIVTWSQFNVTSYLTLGKTLVSFRLWGYVGGSPAIDSTYSDDISILVVTQGTKVEERTTAEGRPLEFNVSPNPVRGNAVIECAALSGDKPVLSVYDAKGTMVKRAIMESCKYIWSTRGLETGVYFVRLDNGSSQSAARKITVISSQ